MQLDIMLSSFNRARGNLPDLPVTNMFAEQTSNEGVILQSRAGLAATSFTNDGKPVRALLKRDNILNGQVFKVTADSSGAKFYRDNTLIGTISTSIPNYGCLAGYEDIVFAIANDDLHAWNGTTLSTIAVPSTGSLAKIVVAANRLVTLGRNTQTFYWSDPLSTTIDALSFATAEASPDRILDMLFVGDVLILFGAETVEFWPMTSDPDLPFQRLQGRTFSVGVKQLGACIEVGSGFSWITHRNTVCINSPDNIISFPGLEAKIAASTNNELWRYFFEGSEFLVVSTDTETWVYSFRSQSWSLFTDPDGSNWSPRCWDNGYFGTSAGDVYTMSSTTHNDLGVTYQKSFRAFANLNAGGVVVNNISVRGNPGNSNASISMRISQDRGNNWTSWRTISYGASGDYRRPLVWRAWGMVSQPGLIVEVKVDEATSFRVSGVFLNEPYGGV